MVDKEIKYVVIVSIVRKDYTKDEAIQVAKRYRMDGCRTEVISLDEFNESKMSDPQQQDLTTL